MLRCLLNVLMPGSLCLALNAFAQVGGPPVVTPDVQARRDAQALQILHTELLAEEAALVRAQGRRSARTQAADPIGAREAEQTVALHSANLAALRREIAERERARASRAGDAARPAAASGNAVGAVSATAPIAVLRVPPPGSTPEAWDLYRASAGALARERVALASASTEAAPDGPAARAILTSGVPPASQPRSRPAWDIYAGRSTARLATTVPPSAAGVHSTDLKEGRP